MEDIHFSLYLLAVLFFAVAFIYSSVGLGGGSSYVALMAIWGVETLAIPSVSLTLNMLVTSIGSFNFIRGKHARAALILPFLISSVPMSYVGGALKLPKNIFYWILLASLLLVVIRIYFWKDARLNMNLGNWGRIILSLAIGSALGLVSGIAGIGGGIYLIPIIIILGLGTEKEAAACGSIFIWVNSLAGLAARIRHNPVDLIKFSPLIIAVIIGGALGSRLGSSKFSPQTMQKALSLIIVVAIVFLARRLLNG